MKLGIISLVFLSIAGCGGEEVTNVSEAGVHDPSSGLCCQITDNETDSSLWHSGRYDCRDDAGLQPFDPPWVCNVNPKSGDCAEDSGYDCLSCNQTECVTGMACLGANGTGVVLACDQQDW